MYGRDDRRDDRDMDFYDDDGMGDRSDRGDDRSQRKFIGGGHYRRKICRFCTDPEFIMDYKNARVLQSFVTEHGKIVPRRISGNCALHQRQLTIAVKRARNLALVGYITPGS